LEEMILSAFSQPPLAINRICFLCVALFAPLSLFAATDDVPKSFAFTRYQPMMDRSPFAVATAVVEPSAPSFAKDLFVANAAKSPDGDMVTIASNSDKNFKKYLNTKATVDGFSISNIEWSEKVGATKVTVVKDGQSATLTFNQALLTQAIGAQGQGQMPPKDAALAGAAPPGPGAPGAPPTSFPKPMPVPSLPMQAAPMPPALQTPPPRVRGVIPRSPGSAPSTNQKTEQPGS
jgi:hypothetical protein